MLASKNRLTGPANFKKVQDAGKIYQSMNFGIAYVDREDSNPSRFAFIVSTKIAKAAVDRNRFKRALSEAVRMETVNFRDGFDVVFLAKTSITRHPTSEVMKEVRKALKAAKLLK